MMMWNVHCYKLHSGMFCKDYLNKMWELLRLYTQLMKKIEKFKLSKYSCWILRMNIISDLDYLPDSVACDLQEKVVAAISHIRKVHWFEKFNWFISSENYLVLSVVTANAVI